MSPEDFRQALMLIGVLMAFWALIMPVLLMLTLTAIGYQHDYELTEPQWTLPGFLAWFFVPGAKSSTVQDCSSLGELIEPPPGRTPIPNRLQRMR